jgi:cysteine desulfurase / selenocysteine lyase
MTLDVTRVRKDFPILERRLRDGQPLIYLDSANTSQKPRQVLDAMDDFYERHNANIHRATHQLGEEATQAYEGARAKVAPFIGAAEPAEVVFTKNVSEAINLVAYAMGNATASGQRGRFSLGPGDEIVITEMEHHSNIVPWQLLCQRTGATLRWFGVTADGRLDSAGSGPTTPPKAGSGPTTPPKAGSGPTTPPHSGIDDLINERTKLVAVVHQSNVLGTINPVRAIADRAHAAGALVLVDAAQSVPHMPVDVVALGADFLGFTAHKMCGPTGIGVLWGRRELLEEMPPFLGGGEMIEQVWIDHSTFAAPPHKFEAGTMPIAQAVGLGAAIDYLGEVGLDAVRAYEHGLIGYALQALAETEGVRILGPTEPVDRGGAISFTVEGVHPHDVSQVLDERGIAVRAGHHCAWPLHRAFGVQASTRASVYLYNTRDEVDALAEGIRETQRFFGVAPGSR